MPYACMARRGFGNPDDGAIPKRKERDVTFRNEWKHEINAADRAVLRARLRVVATPEAHGENGVYALRSLYFDDPWDSALREKTDGVDRREKFRIRYYNDDTSFIRLEKKSKINGLCRKEGAILTAGEVAALLAGRTDFMHTDGRPLVRELSCKMRDRGLRPRVVVAYTREAYCFPAGNVRVTMDYHIRAGLSPAAFLDPAAPTLPVAPGKIILEVKWDAFLPTVIRDAVYLPGRRASAFSKYAACRIYD